MATDRDPPPVRGPLTDRQLDVARLIADDLTNGEIAERLGISLATAKHHVSEILARRGFQSREQIGDWYQARYRRGVTRRLRSALAGPVIWIAAASGVAAVIFVSVIAVARLRSDGLVTIAVMTETPTSAPQLSPSATPTATPDLASTAGAPAEETGPPPGRLAITVLPPIPMPADMVLYISEGCTDCDGPARAVHRIYVNPAGEVRAETLIERPTRTDQPYLNGAVISPTGELVVVECSVPYCGGFDEASEEARITVYRSRDGGTTWTEGASYGEPYRPLAAAANGVLTVMRFPDGPVIRLPVEPVPLPPAAAGRAIALGEDVAWWSDDRRVLLDSEGRTILDLTDLAIDGLTPQGRLAVSLNPSGSRLLVSWSERDEDRVRYVSTSLFDWPDQAAPAVHVATFDGSFGGVWLDEHRVVGSRGFEPEALGLDQGTYAGRTPAILDVRTGELTPIGGPFLRDPYLGGRNRIIGVVSGAIARVDTGGEGCLRVRAEPSLDGAVLDCWAHDGLLQLAEQPVAGAVWVHVTGPRGLDGWASAEFLVY